MRRRTTGWNSAIKPATSIFLRYWLPALLWLVMVGVFSSQSFGSGNTGAVLVSILAFLKIKLSVAKLQLLHYAVRKSAHFIAYGMLSALFFRAVRGPLPKTMWRPLWAIVGLAVCLATASADEFHQLFTPGRGGSARDVMLDMTGAVFAQLLLLAWYLGKPGRAPARARLRASSRLEEQ